MSMKPIDIRWIRTITTVFFRGYFVQDPIKQIILIKQFPVILLPEPKGSKQYTTLNLFTKVLKLRGKRDSELN